MNRKFLLIIIVIAVVLGLAAYFVFSSSTSQKSMQAHARWISAHTSGTVSAHSPVKIYFTKNIIEESQTGTAIAKGIFDISPSTEGQAIWIQQNVLEFTPTQPFKNGQTYDVEIDLKAMIDSLKTSNYQFSFNVIKQDFSIDIEGITPVNIQKAEMLKVYGNLSLADKTSADLVHKMLTAEVNKKSYPVKWEADKNGRNYQFTIDSILRTENSQKLTIEYTGTPINIDKKGRTSYNIPSKNEFILTGHKVLQHPNQQIILYFSDPVKRFQELNGLIKLKKIEGYQIDVADNRIMVLPNDRQKITDQLSIFKGIQSINGKTLSIDTVFEVCFEDLKPAVREKNNDIILPPSEQGALFAFEAVNLKAVDIRIYQIFENNIIQFLQVNNLNEDYQIQRVGKPIFEQTLVLDQYANTDLGQWNTFYINLNKIVQQSLGALYHIQINFRHENAITQCDNNSENSKAVLAPTEFWKNFDHYSYTDNYSWKKRNDPCDPAYYGSRRAIKHNFMVSDIGLIAKIGQNEKLTIFTTQLSTSEILPDVQIDILDYQQQVVAGGKTDNNGKISFEKLKEPFFVRATNKQYTSYLKLTSFEALSYSHFPTDGVTVQSGLKGFIYNERGVYRPGDTIYTGFMLQDLTQNLPANAPITIELYNARSQQVGRKVLTRNNTNHYLVQFPTKTDDETGSWNIKVIVGNQIFNKSVSVETIKPNRLKLNIDTKKTVLSNDRAYINLDVEWLHGAPVSKLKYTVEASANKSNLKFDKFPEFEFNHKENKLTTLPQMYQNDKLDAAGKARFPIYTPKIKKLPSKINLSYFFKIFESNGNFSIGTTQQSYLPYTSYVGLRLPNPNGRYNMYQTNKKTKVDVVAVSAKGEKINDAVRAKVQIYKVAWSWWWESASDFDYRYHEYKKLTQTKYVTIQNGIGSFDFTVDHDEWGRYLIEVTNMRNNQSASTFIYFDWPSIAGRTNRPEGVSQNMLCFAAEKENYQTGETVSLSFPTSAGGKALVSIENGIKIIEDYWVDTQEGETSFSFKTTPEMSPNCYINIHYLQPYQRTSNDLPLRMYGVTGINVIDPSKKLRPVIEMEKTIESGKPFEITISEQEGTPMNYSIAIVDEGLLALTNFKTPSPYNYFFSHEALGVLTYDLFDWVIGAFVGTIERVIGIGGGADRENNPSQITNQRFKPIAMLKGPFKLNKGDSKLHQITLPPYIGKIRTMVIARNETAFGNAECYSKVKSPLMVIATAPRKLVMNDKFILPVNIFRNQSSLGTVSIEIKHDKLIKIKNAQRKISFKSGQQEKMLYFECETLKNTGSTQFNIQVKDNNYTAVEALKIDIYNPSPTIYNVDYVRLNNNENRTITIDPIGSPSTNKLTAEIATIPPFNIQKHVHYLLNYPHGCLEQTVSGAFGLIYAPKIIDLENDKKDEMEKKITAALEKLNKFQLQSGGMGYWQGSQNVNQWGTNYAGHFMLIAEKAGYKINSAIYNKWIRYQKAMAKNFTDNGPTSRYNQAYRLYTLALAGKPERGAMNRLRSINNLEPTVTWRLSAAYCIAGRKKAANKLINELSSRKNITPIHNTYGSQLREQAMVLQTLNLLGKDTESYNLILDMSDQVIDKQWISTQTRAWVLYALGEFYRNRVVAREINISYSINNGKKEVIKSNKHIINVNLPMEFSIAQNVKITNESGGEIFLQLINQGKPLPKEITAGASNLSIDVNYMDFNKHIIDVENLKQTTDIIAKIEVTHPGIKSTYKDLALTFNAPSGWEIINTRFTEFEGMFSESNYAFRNFCDTKVMTYFDLDKGHTKTFYIKLNAAYSGQFYFAPIHCEAMYDNLINARTKSQFILIDKKE